jgi:transposase
MTESEKTQIIVLRRNGMSFAQIQQMMSMTPAEFRKGIRELKENGEFPPKKTGSKKVLEAYENGERNPYKIAETYGLTPLTVQTYKKKNGIVTGRGKRNFKHSQRTNAINKDLKDGIITCSEIAQKHGVSRQFVYQLRKKLEEDEEL